MPILDITHNERSRGRSNILFRIWNISNSNVLSLPYGARPISVPGSSQSCGWIVLHYCAQNAVGRVLVIAVLLEIELFEVVRRRNLGPSRLDCSRCGAARFRSSLVGDLIWKRQKTPLLSAGALYRFVIWATLLSETHRTCWIEVPIVRSLRLRDFRLFSAIRSMRRREHRSLSIYVDAVGLLGATCEL